jgi:hypothetical protein
MSTRPVIDMAQGILMAGFSCSTETAWDILVRVSEHSDTKLREVANCLVEGIQPGGEIPRSLQQHLSAVVQDSRHGGRSHRAGI